MRTAFKEWAIVVEALGRGEQIIILRKGGIHDTGGLFRLEHRRFWLFPTLYHQQADSVVESARSLLDSNVSHSLNDERVAIQFLAVVETILEIGSLDEAKRLSGQHIWRDDVIEQRFDWGSKKGVHALLVRVFSLPTPVETPRLASYGGCRSWIDLEKNIGESGLTPVLSDTEYAARTRRAQRALQLPTEPK